MVLFIIFNSNSRLEIVHFSPGFVNRIRRPRCRVKTKSCNITWIGVSRERLLSVYTSFIITTVVLYVWHRVVFQKLYSFDKTNIDTIKKLIPIQTIKIVTHVSHYNFVQYFTIKY